MIVSVARTVDGRGDDGCGSLPPHIARSAYCQFQERVKPISSYAQSSVAKVSKGVHYLKRKVSHPSRTHVRLVSRFYALNGHSTSAASICIIIKTEPFYEPPELKQLVHRSLPGTGNLNTGRSAMATKLQLTTYLLGVCLFSICFLVFVNASVSFVITDVVHQKKDVGNAAGTLGFADELLAVVTCPLWGLLSDRVGFRNVCATLLRCHFRGHNNHAEQVR